MKRRLLNLLNTLSLLLCVSVTALWGRASWGGELIFPLRETAQGLYVVRVSERATRVMRVAATRPGPWASASIALQPPPARVFVDLPNGLLIATLAALPALWFARWLRRPEDDDGTCPVCGYDLRATPDRCPECGTRPSTHQA